MPSSGRRQHGATIPPTVGDNTSYRVFFPNDPLWKAVLNGLLIQPCDPEFWDNTAPQADREAAAAAWCESAVAYSEDFNAALPPGEVTVTASAGTLGTGLHGSETFSVGGIIAIGSEYFSSYDGYHGVAFTMDHACKLKWLGGGLVPRTPYDGYHCFGVYILHLFPTGTFSAWEPCGYVFSTDYPVNNVKDVNTTGLELLASGSDFLAEWEILAIY